MTEQALTADILNQTADLIENRAYTRFAAGPETWTALHDTIYQLVISPTIAALLAHLDIKQVQHWGATKDQVVTTLRTVATDTAAIPLSEQQHNDALRRIEAARTLLCAALGVPTGEDISFAQLAEAITRERRWLIDERDRLAEQIQAATGEPALTT